MESVLCEILNTFHNISLINAKVSFIPYPTSFCQQCIIGT